MMISKEVIEELSGIVADRDVEVLVQEDMPATLVDPVKFKQVISNLVGNAIKHAAPEQSLRVEIGGYEEPDTTVFFVRDDGLGIEYDRQKKVFEPFEHVENGNHIPGAGLGLSIVKRDVEGWGGIIWLESTPGKGTTFSFTIPA
jgi:signal transduction histidine kinase